MHERTISPIAEEYLLDPSIPIEGEGNSPGLPKGLNPFGVDG
jgi:hypothetical protein